MTYSVYDTNFSLREYPFFMAMLLDAYVKSYLCGIAGHDARAELKNSFKIICISPGLLNLSIYNSMNKCRCECLKTTITWYAKKIFLHAVICCAHCYFVSFGDYIIDYPPLLNLQKFQRAYASLQVLLEFQRNLNQYASSNRK